MRRKTSATKEASVTAPSPLRLLVGVAFIILWVIPPWAPGP